jgi:hypothetical protein
MARLGPKTYLSLALNHSANRLTEPDRDTNEDASHSDCCRSPFMRRGIKAMLQERTGSESSASTPFRQLVAERILGQGKLHNETSKTD